MDKSLIRVSKFLSLVLRHKPQTIGLTLEEGGWASVDELLAAAPRAGVRLTEELLKQVVEQNDKRRFALSEDGRRIRASQGHSLSVELGLEPSVPPEFLYHGTATRFIESIRERGLISGSRRHVHLSKDEPAALAVGKRHGEPVVLIVRSGRMREQGLEFFLSDNGVWLTESVPAEFILFPERTT